MSDGLVIVSLLTVIAVGKVWLELFEDIFSLFLSTYILGLSCFLEKIW